MAGVKLTAKWQLDAAMLSRPVDLTALVSMSRTSQEKFLDDNTLHRLISTLLNEKNANKSDKDTKLDVLNILGNVAIGSKACCAEVRMALGGVSEWFDEYIATEESDPQQEPELHKAMVLLLARCWNYSLKTEDVLELCQGDRCVALMTVVGLLEDGETYSTELKQRQAPGQGKMGQWEHELVCQRYERPLLLQVCRLLRGFTHPGTYFESTTEELALYSVEKFAEEMDNLLDITLKTRLVEKLSVALYDCLFEQEDNLDEDGKDGETDYHLLEESDHTAVTSVHAFLQNLYFYASQNNEEFRRHMLMDTLLIPRLVLPYLDRCVLHATILNSRAEAYSDMLEGDRIAEMALHNPQLVKGLAASLRTLIIASFRAPATQFVMALLRKLNPTAQILRARAFCKHHEYIFALLCLLNVNMGALDLSRNNDNDESSSDAVYANVLLQDLASIYSEMDNHSQQRVYKRVMYSGALPISRDTPSYVSVMAVLLGGAAGQLEYGNGSNSSLDVTLRDGSKEEDEHVREGRDEIKRSGADRIAQQITSPGGTITAEPKSSEVLVDVYEAKGKDRKPEKKSEIIEKDKGYRLLGNLPSFNKQDKEQEQHLHNIKIALSLELPKEGKSNDPMIMKGGMFNKPKNSSNPDIPEEFLCCINGHVMKEPIKAKTSGLVFERATIELWLGTRGSICPITNEVLTRDDLEPLEELRNRIKRYHIQQTSMRKVKEPEDDLYDF